MNNDENYMEGATGGNFWKVLISLIVGGAIGFGLGYYWYEIKPEGASKNDEAKDKTEMSLEELSKISQLNAGLTLVATDNEASIKTSDQNAGQSVSVDSVSITNAGWVAVREDAVGQLGKILGARRLDAGLHTDIMIDLLRATVAGETYYSVLYRDDGDKIFNQQLDSIVERDGKILLDAFVAK